MINYLKKLFFKIQKKLSGYGYGPGKKLSPLDYIALELPFDKLHIGCGNVHIKGWCNVDVLQTGATDLVTDITTLAKIPNEAVSEIYCCHILEHFPTDEIATVLATWHNKLKVGGVLRISVPDLDKITKVYQDNLDHFNVPGNQPWVSLIYGGQKDLYDFHKTGFNLCWLSYLLKSAGFTEITEFDYSEHFVNGVYDNSVQVSNFGVNISLNVKAIKR